MRKSLVVAAAAATLIGTWAALAAQPDPQPAARAYLSYGFGAPKKAKDAPLHFGLRMDYDQGLQPYGQPARPPLMQFDFDSRGNRIASAGGVPFAARLIGPMRQSEGGAPATEGAEGGFSFFDWGLLAVGIGGIGYLVYEVTKGKDSKDPPGTTTGGSGGLTGGLTGGGSTGSTTGGLGGLCTLVPALCGGAGGGTTGYTSDTGEFRGDLRDLGGGNGTMGDLIPQH